MNYLIRRKTKEDCAPVVHVATVVWNETYKGIVDDDLIKYQNKKLGMYKWYKSLNEFIKNIDSF